MTISSEQRRLEIIRALLNKPTAPGTGIPIQLVLNAEDQDDCAVYNFPGDLSLVVGTDFVRGTGFALFHESYLSYFDIGYYLVVANLSDIAAMGAGPIGLTTVVRYTSSLEDTDFIHLIEGMQAAASRYNTPIVGGDIGGYQEMVLAATAFGITERGKYLTRQGTKVGDLLCITGTVGLPSTALVYFTRARRQGFSLSDEEEQQLLNSWRRPVARISEGLALVRSGVVHACQDVSDGVKATIHQLGQAGTVSFEIHETRLPISPTTRKVAEFFNIDPVALAVGASVDFQLMFTVEQKDLPVVQAELSDDAIVLGRAISASEPSRLVRADGSSKSPIPGTAWNQQTGHVADIILGGN